MLPVGQRAACRFPAANWHCSSPCSADSEETAEGTTLALLSSRQTSPEHTDGAAAKHGTKAAQSVCSDPQVVAALWQRVHSFMACVTASPLVRSALVAQELSGRHVPAQVAAAGSNALVGGTRWTLAQMLALHLRAGYTEATEAGVLSGLLVLESQHSGCCSDAHSFSATCVQHLAAMAPEAVDDWQQLCRGLQASVAAAQLDLLEKVGWKASLDFGAEVQPCHSLLFRLPAATLKQLQMEALLLFPPEQPLPASKPLPPAGAADAWQQAPGMAAARATWAVALHRMCNSVRLQALLLAQQHAGLRVC